MNSYLIKIYQKNQVTEITAQKGENLREVLLKNGISPYGKLSATLNCGGRGLCATCGITFISQAPQAEHWHDVLAAKYGYPRLSCCISIHQDMQLEIITDKVLWGQLLPGK
jgi:ferredoxin